VKRKILKRIYISTIMFFLKRGFKAINIEKNIKKEINFLPQDFCFSIDIHPFGPKIVIKKCNNGLKFLNPNRENNINLSIIFKNIERAFSVFTFKKSPFLCYAQNGLIIKGDLSHTMTVIRILSMLEVYLLPKFIVKNVLKRYPELNFFYKLINRILIYFRILTGI